MRVRFLPSAEGALVALEADTRLVRALVGGFDYEESPFNRAVQARRQVGSSIKPFVYAAALQAGIATPSTIYQDQPATYPLNGDQLWSPRNYDGRYLGPMSLREALARSRNVISVRVMDQLFARDRRATLDFFEGSGLGAELPENLTLALGSLELPPLELTNAFATIAADGLLSSPSLIERVDGPVGVDTWIYEAPERSEDPELRPLMDPDTAWLTRSLMESVVLEGTARRAQQVGHPAAGKTGTTNAVRDAWFAGFTPHLVAGVWVGRDSNETLGRGESGGSTALPIWTSFMASVHSERELVDFPDPPETIVTRSINPADGLLARSETVDAYTEYFLTNTEPREYTPTAQDLSLEQLLLGGSTAAEGDGVLSPNVGDEAVAPAAPVDQFDGF